MGEDSEKKKRKPHHTRTKKEKKATQHTFGREFAKHWGKKKEVGQMPPRQWCHSVIRACWSYLLLLCLPARASAGAKEKREESKKKKDRRKIRKRVEKKRLARGPATPRRKPNLERRRGRRWRRQQVTSGLKRDPTESALGRTTASLGAPAHRPTDARAHCGMGSCFFFFRREVQALARKRKKRERERETPSAYPTGPVCLGMPDARPFLLKKKTAPCFFRVCQRARQKECKKKEESTMNRARILPGRWEKGAQKGRRVERAVPIVQGDTALDVRARP